MTSELDIFAKLKQINDSEETLKYVSIFPYTDEHAMMVSKHRAIQRLSRPERPSTATTYRVGIYTVLNELITNINEFLSIIKED